MKNAEAEAHTLFTCIPSNIACLFCREVAVVPEKKPTGVHKFTVISVVL